MAAIDVGAAAIDRGSSFNTSTIIAKDNPANLDGKITEVQIYVTTELANCEVAIFTEGAPDTFTTRDNQVLGSGTIPVGYSTHVVDLDVVAGDFIGIYYSTDAGIDRDTSGGAGLWYVLGTDHIPCTDQLFSFVDTHIMSLKGIGAEVEPPGLENKSAGMGAKLIAGKLI